MEELDLQNNPGIGDDAAAMFLECMKNIKVLWLLACKISQRMKNELNKCAAKEGCELNV